MTIGVSNMPSASISVAIWKVECGPTSEMNCFGRLSRDSGQTRVPVPPHMMTGRIFTFFRSLAKNIDSPFQDLFYTHGRPRLWRIPHNHRRLCGKCRLFPRVRAKPQQIAHVVRGAAGADNIYRLFLPGMGHSADSVAPLGVVIERGH